MKINARLLGLMVALGFFLLAFSIYFWGIQRKSKIIIDNPSNQTIDIGIDGQKYSVAPLDYFEIPLKPGLHRLKHQAIDTLIDIKSQSLINPTLQPYVIYHTHYGLGGIKDSLMASATLFKLDGRLYKGTASIDSSLVIHHFYFHIDEKFPLLAKKAERKSVIYSKIFRKNAFLEWYTKQ